MNKNYLIIGLIILALVVIGVIAARQPDATLPEEEQGTETETEETPSVSVSDQVVTDNSVIVDNVYSETAGWIVLHRTTEDGELDPAAIAGSAAVQAGENQDVVIELAETVENGELLVAILHSDTGAEGEYEFSEETPDLDTPVQVDGEVVISFFTVSTEEETEEAVEETEAEADAEAEGETETEAEATE